MYWIGWNISDCIATQYELGSPGLEFLWGRDILHLSEKFWVTPSLLYHGFWFFPGVKAAGRDVDRPPASSTKLKERLELYLCSPSGPTWPVQGRNFTSTLTFTYWRGKSFDLLPLIADMLYLTQYMFWDVSWGCLKTGCSGEYLGPRGTR